MMELTEKDRRFMKMACDLASDNIDGAVARLGL